MTEPIARDKINIVIAGASGAGKTTLANGLRECCLARTNDLVVARRLVTRPARLGETDAESEFIDAATLRWRLGEGIARFTWRRDMGRRAEWYAFETPDEAPVTAFPANDAILGNLDEFQARFRGLTAVVIITCPQNERERRLQDRSPDLWANPEELAVRLAPAVIPVNLGVPICTIESVNAMVALHTVLGLIDGLRLTATLPTLAPMPPTDGIVVQSLLSDATAA